MESETKLLPCPFCGGTPHLQCDHKFFVLCLNCHCAVGERYDPDGWPAHEFSTAADAIAAWNTRASDPAALAVVEALEKIAEGCWDYTFCVLQARDDLAKLARGAREGRGRCQN